MLVTYTLDAHHRIIHVNGGWDTFAEQNGAPSLTAPHVLGQTLWHLIPAAEPLFLPLLQSVHRRQLPLTLGFRCDAPDERRLLEMTLVPASQRGTMFRVTPVRVQPRPPVGLLSPEGPRTHEYVVMCSWCKRVAVDVEWLEVEVALRRLRILEHTALPQVTHGMCPRCASNLLAGAEAFGARPWVDLPDAE